MNELDLFAAALAIADPAERAAFLDRECAGQPALRERLEQLLEAHARSNPLLDVPPADRLERTKAYTPSEQPGTVVAGRYKLLEAIGEGGMGVVWAAEQTEPIKRRVALKLIKPGMDSRSVLGRFEAERQALAVMDHPNIAKVLDAGSTTDGRPYFVMELVKGTPITEFCDARRLTPKERLELFVPVCQAIQHAHMKGIIHRDIKPSNVLVALHDEIPVPMVIDFGVAKAVGQQLTEKTIYTGFGALVGTPAYMAPEQATFNQLDIDTRADVYALGVVLYELLAGSPPIEAERLKKAAFDELLRIVRDEEPPRPSQRLSTSQAKASIAATRRSEPTKLSELMKGEIDWIVMKALEKDRTRRYETANGLAKDIQRYLNGDSVEACPPTFGYKLKKAYRRHRAAVLTASAFVFTGLVAVAIMAYLAVRATNSEKAALVALEQAEHQRKSAEIALEDANVAREREAQQRSRADREASLAKATERFLVNELLEAGDPNLTGGKKVSVDEVLQRAAANVGKAFGNQPEVEVGIRDTLARAFIRLGKTAAGREQATAGLALHRRLHGEGDWRTLAARNDLAEVLAEEGKPAEAEKELRDVLAASERSLGEKHEVSLSFRNNLSAHLWRQRRFAEAVPLTRRTYEIQLEVLGPDHQSTLVSLSNLGIQLLDMGRKAEAEPLILKASADCERVLGRTHPATISAMNNLAALRRDQRKLEEAATLYRQVAEASAKALSEEHPKTVTTLNNLADVYTAQGKPGEAVEVYCRVLAILKSHYPAHHEWRFGVLEHLANVCERQGKLAAAEEFWREFHQTAVKPPLGINHRVALRAQAEVARLLADQKKWSEAENWYRTALALQIQTLGANHADVQLTRMGLASALMAEKKFAAAEPLLRDWLKYCPKLSPAWWREYYVSTLLGECLLAQKKYAEAEPLLVKGYEGMKKERKVVPAQNASRLPKTLDLLIELSTATNKPDDLKKWRAERATDSAEGK
jgi:eukaryotic-like serine/threonine-protein kinase